MRKIIVCGAPTAGKSTFSRLLVEHYAVSHVGIDPIIEAFQSVYPEWGISHEAPDHMSHLRVCRAFSPFLLRMIQGMDEDDFVVEGFRMPLDDLAERFRSTHQFFVFGFPRISLREKFRLVRKHDGRGNWTGAESDASLKRTLSFLIRESAWLEKRCRVLGVPFFDTGRDYWGGVEKAMAQVL